MTASSPVIIGATGGSGTRVVARIARRAGYNLGSYINEANDALAFRSFHDRWINRFLGMRGPKAITSDVDRATKDFHVALSQHLGSAMHEQILWGWKAPRSIYLLPFLHTQFPGLKFIHVIRDGRDMAFSRNQNQLRKHALEVLSWSERLFSPTPVRSILLWARINLQASEFSEKHLGQNYCLVRFEDLCQRPVETTANILRFLEVELDPQGIAAAEILAPSSIGRWQNHPPRLISKMTAVGEKALRKFGYL